MTYLYSCERCGEFEFEQRITDAPLDACPSCSSCAQDIPVKRLISGAPTFALKPGASGGWASEGYSKPENHRQAEAKLGHKVQRKL